MRQSSKKGPEQDYFAIEMRLLKTEETWFHNLGLGRWFFSDTLNGREICPLISRVVLILLDRMPARPQHSQWDAITFLFHGHAIGRWCEDTWAFPEALHVFAGLWVSRISCDMKGALRKWSPGTERSDCRYSAITESEFFRLRLVVVGRFSNNGKVTLRKWSPGTECSDCRYSAITEQHLFVSANVELLSSRRLTLEGWWSLSIDHSDMGSVAPGAPHLSMAPPGGISFTGLQFHPRLLFWHNLEREREEEELSAQSG